MGHLRPKPLATALRAGASFRKGVECDTVTITLIFALILLQEVPRINPLEKLKQGRKKQGWVKGAGNNTRSDVFLKTYQHRRTLNFNILQLFQISAYFYSVPPQNKFHFNI